MKIKRKKIHLGMNIKELAESKKYFNKYHTFCRVRLNKTNYGVVMSMKYPSRYNKIKLFNINEYKLILKYRK